MSNKKPHKSSKCTESLEECQNCLITLSSYDIETHKLVCQKTPVNLIEINSGVYNHGFIIKMSIFSKLAIQPASTLNTDSNSITQIGLFINPIVMRHCGLHVGKFVLVNDKFLCYVFSKPNIRLMEIQLSEKISNMFNLIESETISIKSYNKHLRLANCVYWSFTNSNIHKNEEWVNGFNVYLSFQLQFMAINSELVLKLVYFGDDVEIIIKKVNSCETIENLTLENSLYFKVCTDTIFYKYCKNTNVAKKKKLKNFDSVGGLKDEKKRLLEFLEMFKKHQFSSLPSGIILHGPNGTGKTVLAHGFLEIAESYDISTITITSIDILSKYQGESEIKLKNRIAESIRNQPSILLIEDIDVICSTKTLSAIFAAELDSFGFNQYSILPIATCNKIEKVDMVLRSFGRFDYEIETRVPNDDDRLEILKCIVVESDVKFDKDVDLKILADVAHGYVGSDLLGVFKEASLFALRSDRNFIKQQDIIESFSRIKPSAIREIIISVPDTKWSDIGGQESLKLKLKQAVEWPITKKEAFKKLGIKPPKGLLMYGPPGCSKTLTARALAHESKLNFLAIKGPELLSKWVGESEKAVRQLFKKARQSSPAIIFFDEIDAIATKRQSSSNSTADVSDRVLAQLLTEIDGVATLDNVTIVAATNRPDRIDPALLRPGRLDRLIYVPLPDFETRLEILKIHSSKTKLSTDINLENFAEKTVNYSGAELEALIREAALLAIGEEGDSILNRHLEAALINVTPRTDLKMIKFYDNFAKNIP